MVKSTIIIPNYNGIDYIEACLDSLYQNDSSKFAIIVVDNASKDGSLSLIQEKYPKVQLIINEKNEGFDVAVNQGIVAAKTEYVILLNNDTCVAKEFVSELEKVMESDAGIFSASAKMISLHEKEKMDDAGDFYCALGWAFAKGKGKHPDLFQKSYEVFAACAGAAIYRKSVFEQIGLFDEEHFAYLEDIDIGYRAKIYGYRNVFAPKAVVYHAGSATSGSRYNEFKTKLASRNSIYVIYKNMPLFQWILNLPFLILGFLVKTLFFIKKGYGSIYIKGLLRGFTLSASKAGRAHKVKFQWKHGCNYVKIQFALWRNLFRILEK